MATEVFIIPVNTGSYSMGFVVYRGLAYASANVEEFADDALTVQ